MQKLTKFKVIFDLFTVCVDFIQQQNCKLYYIYLMIISEIQSEIGHCSCDSAKFKAPADFSHHAILCMTLSLDTFKMLCPLNKAKVIFKGSRKNQFYFPILNVTLSFLQKYLFLLLSFQLCNFYGTCSQKCTGNF